MEHYIDFSQNYEDSQIEAHCKSCKYWVSRFSPKHCGYLIATGHSRAMGQQHPLDCKGYPRRNKKNDGG